MATHDDDDFTLEGISLPEGAWLPPEISQNIKRFGLAEIRIIIVAIAEELTVGGGHSLSLSDFEERTGLSRTSCVDGIEGCIKKGVLVRRITKGRKGQDTFQYSVRVAIAQNKTSSPTLPDPSLSSRSLTESRKDSGLSTTTLTTSDLLKNIQQILEELGVFKGIAKNFVNTKQPDFIMDRVRAYKVMLRTGNAEGVGWLVDSIKYNWPVDDILKNPGKYDPEAKARKDYISGPYAEFIEH